MILMPKEQAETCMRSRMKLRHSLCTFPVELSVQPEDGGRRPSKTRLHQSYGFFTNPGTSDTTSLLRRIRVWAESMIRPLTKDQ